MDVQGVARVISNYANIIHDIVVTEVKTNVEDSVAFVVRYIYREKESKFIIKLDNQEDVTDTELEGNLRAEIGIVEECIRVLDRLNSEISSISNIRVAYLYSGSARTRIHSWSYDEIEINMDKQACINLVNNIDTIDVKKYAEYYQGNLAEIVNGYNECALHRIIGTQLIDSVYEELRYSLLSRKDAIQYAEDNKRNGIEQADIRFALCIEDLCIVALIEWHIDYKKNVCKTSLYNNRIIDMSSNLAIRDEAILNSVIELTRLRDNERYRVFSKII